MRRLREFLRKTLIVIGALALLAVVAIVVFLYRNNAPITTGDIEYGIKYKNELKLDLYRPTRITFDKSPVIFFIHGGAWIGGTKGSVNFNRVNGAVNTLRDEGYTVISPDYSLAGTERSVFPDCILDIYDAVEWTKTNASLYNLDATNIGLMGESAGAHIAMMLTFPDKTLQPDKYESTRFSYLVDIYGPNDLTDLYHGKTLEKIEASVKKVSKVFGSTFNIKQYVFGFDPVKDSVRAKALLEDFSPINLLTKKDLPVLIIHGTGDQIVPVQQSIVLKNKLDSLGIPNELHLMDSVDHNFRKATTAQKDSMQVWISDFVMRNYRK